KPPRDRHRSSDAQVTQAAPGGLNRPVEAEVVRQLVAHVELVKAMDWDEHVLSVGDAKQVADHAAPRSAGRAEPEGGQLTARGRRALGVPRVAGAQARPAALLLRRAVVVVGRPARGLLADGLGLLRRAQRDA